jgi:hypothetical protein
MNQIDNLDKTISAAANRVISELNLSGYEIKYFPEAKSLHFKKNFKELSLPVTLIEKDRWVDIRHLFRAAFQAGPQVVNYGASNDWCRPKTRAQS